MPRVWSIAPMLFLLTVAVCVGDEPPPKFSSDERLATLQRAHHAEHTAYSQAVEDLPDTEKGNKTRQERWQRFDRRQSDWFLAAVELAKLDPHSEVSLEALEWVLSIPRSYYLPVGKPAMMLAELFHATNPRLGKTIATIGGVTPHEGVDSHEAAQSLLRAVAERNTDRVARGNAYLGLAWFAKRQFAAAERKKSSDVETYAAETERLCDLVVKDYADCPCLALDEERTLGDEARQELFALRHLRVGKVAPELEGEDLQGAKLKLSDSRGNVTVVAFWASWCGPCMAMIPYERELVARLKDRPFVLLGVNGDEDRELAKQLTVQHEMAWRSFWNGPDGEFGPVARAWNVRGWPTVYILDERGVIRHKNLRGEELDKAVDELLAELKPDGR